MSKYYQLDMIAKAIKPQLVNNIWRKPKLSARSVARVKQECLRYGTINGVQAQWNAEWDKPKKSWIPRPPKGHADEREQLSRIELIDKNMKEMPKWIAETRKEAYLSKTHTFMDIKLAPEDYDDFYKIGQRLNAEQKKRQKKIKEENEKKRLEKEASKAAKGAKGKAPKAPKAPKDSQNKANKEVKSI